MDAKNKDRMTLKELCEYLDISRGYAYILTHKRAIPFYKPNGKKIYFLKSEVDQWLFKNRIKSKSEVEKEATDYVLKSKKTNKNGK